jgi:hypothetical protein
MNEPQMTKEQEALLGEALECSKIFEQQAKDLSKLGDALATKWEEGLLDTQVVSNPMLTTS